MDARPSTATRPRHAAVSPAQIVAIGLVAASLAGAAWLLREAPTVSEAPLLDGTALDAAQLAAVEAALDRAGLTDYRTEAGQVWVPRSRQSAYKRAVVDADALPKPWGTRFHEAIAAGGVWVSPAARAESLKVARQDELALVLGSMPGIERAAVLYDEERGDGFRQDSIKTASVGVRTLPGAELDAVRAHGIRVLVAASVAGLDPRHVAVTDLATGRVFAGPLDETRTGLDSVLGQRMAVEGAIAARLRQTLEFVPGAIVAVAVDAAPPPPPAASGRATEADAPVGSPVAAAANAPAEVDLAGGAVGDATTSPGAGPSSSPSIGAVRVTVSLPDAYLDGVVAAARARAARGPGVEPSEADLARGEIDRLRDLVTGSLPGIADPARVRVVVTTHAAPHEARAEVAPAPGAGPMADADAPPPSPGTQRWMTLASVLVGTLAGALWWVGSRGREVPSWPRDVPATSETLGEAQDETIERRRAA